MGYSGAEVSKAVAAMVPPTQRTARRMAEHGGKRLEHLARRHTPVDTGELKSRWYILPVIQVGNSYRVEVANDTEYAHWIEHGWGLWGPKHSKYWIVPKKPGGVLTWLTPEGERVFARRVRHPGAPGAHMLAIAAAETEAEFDSLMFRLGVEWVLEAGRAFELGGKL
jgi:hypothetical protein